MAGSFALPRNKVTTIREGGKTFNIYGTTDDANPFYLRRWLQSNQDLPDGEYDVGPERAADGSVPVGSINVSNGTLLKGQQVGPSGRDEISSQRVWRRPAAVQQQQSSGSAASQPAQTVDTKPYQEARDRAEQFARSSQSAQAFAPRPLFGAAGGSQGGGGGGEFDIYNQLFARGEELGQQYGRFIRQSQLNNDEAMQAAALGLSQAVRGLPSDLALSRPMDLDTSVDYVKRFRSLVNP